MCGSANNQLLEPEHGVALADRGILYAPDFVVNGGGVINVAEELGPGGYQTDRAMGKVSKIYDILVRVFAIAEEKNIPTYAAADILAEERIEKALRQKRMFL